MTVYLISIYIFLHYTRTTITSGVVLQERGREARVLSPGLLYLEQVCQILEDIAKQQMQNRETQAEFDTLCEHQELQVSQVNSVTTEHFTMRHS